MKSLTRITDETEIRVFDTDRHVMYWRGPIAKFEQMRLFGDAECAQIRTDLAIKGFHTITDAGLRVFTVAPISKYPEVFAA